MGQWQACAMEGGLCQFNGLSVVRFGSAGTWSEAIYQNEVQCTAALFGAAATGTGRSCQVSLESITEAPAVTSQSSAATSSAGAPGVPPFSGTVFLDRDIIRAGDPSLYTSMAYKGEVSRSAWHSEFSAVRTFNAYAYDLSFSDGDIVEVAVEMTVGSQAQAKIEVDKLAIPLGQIPAIMRKKVNSVTVFAGDGRGTASGGGLISTYATANTNYIRDGFLEEFLTHESTHVSLDAIYYPNSGYQRVKQNDNNFVSTYAKENPTSEDISETIVPYLAVQLRADRISADAEAKIRAAIGQRMAFFDVQNIDWSPVHKTANLVRSEMTAPSAGATLQDIMVTFEWAAPANATLFDLLLGTSGAGSTDIRQTQPTTDTFLTIATLPNDGRKVYARLRTQLNGQWRYQDYSYQGFNRDKIAAQLLTPEMGAFLNSPELSVKWDKPAGADAFDLFVGDQGVGSNNLRASAITKSTNFNLVSLPLHGKTLYLRLFTHNGRWQYRDYTVIAASNASRAELILPAPNSSITSSTVQFKWNTPVGASAYDLLLGTSGPGSTDIRASNVISTNTLTVNNMPTDGRTIYLRLWTNKNNWEYIDYTF